MGRRRNVSASASPMPPRIPSLTIAEHVVDEALGTGDPVEHALMGALIDECPEAQALRAVYVARLAQISETSQDPAVLFERLTGRKLRTD